jgi:sulfonate transport system substrate-binding protein
LAGRIISYKQKFKYWLTVNRGMLRTTKKAISKTLTTSVLIIVVALVAGITGFYSGTLQATQQVRPITVTMRTTETFTTTAIYAFQPVLDRFKLGSAQPNTPDFIVWHIAKERGIFKKYLPNVELVEFAGGTGELVRALSDGSIQVGWGLTEGILLGVVKGAKIGIVSTIMENPLRWIIVVKPDAPYKSIQDLKGKTIATSRPGGGSHIVTLKAFSDLGWIEGRDYYINPIGDLNAMIAGVKAGTLDALTFSRGVLTPLIEKGELRILAEVNYQWPEFSLAATRDFASKNPEAIRAVILALNEAMRIFNNEKDYAIGFMKSKFGLSDAAAEEFYTYVRHSLDGVIFLSSLDKAQDFLILGGVMTKEERIKPIEAFIQGFAPIKP